MTTSTAAAHVITTGKLDADDALALLEQVVNEHGLAHTEDRGTYFAATDSIEYASTPVDLLGHLFDKLGKTAFDLVDLDDPDAAPQRINDCWISSIGLDGIDITDAARAMFYEAQTAEHNGADWGKQLDAARFAHTNRHGLAILAAAA